MGIYSHIVVGAGISGLSVAEALARKGANVLVLEAAAEVGGVMRSERTSEGFLLEHGPNTVTSNSSALWQHFSDLGVELITASHSGKKRYVCFEGELVPLPLDPASFVKSPLLSPAAKVRILAEPFIPAAQGPDESIAAFFTRRIGREPAERMIDPFVSGVYAGDPQSLSMAAAFPRFWEAEQRAGSLIRGMLTRPKQRPANGAKRSRREMFSFQQGLNTWPQAIAQYLGPERLWTASRVLEIRPTSGGWQIELERDGKAITLQAEQLILATPAAQAAELIAPHGAEAAQALRAIPYPPIALVHLGYKRDDIRHPLDGFGALYPSRESRKALGTLWPSALFAERAPADSVLTTSFIGGARHPDRALQSDDTLIELAHNEQIALIGAQDTPVFSKVVRWEWAIPQYVAGHQQRIAAIDALEGQKPGLHLIGNYRNGVSVEHCWISGQALSERLLPAVQPVASL